MFKAKLKAAVDFNDSQLCVGLDPDIRKTEIKDFLDFNKNIIRLTNKFVAAYKLNMSCYEVGGSLSWRALEMTVSFLKVAHPNIMIILDGKRGDIPHTAKNYAYSAFEHLGVDAVTASPMYGWDSAKEFLRYAEKGTFFVVKTSNNSANDLQNIAVTDYYGLHSGFPLFEEVALQTQGWGNPYDNSGFIVGATRPADIKACRSLCSTTPILVPGVGAQGGDVQRVVKNGIDKDGYGLLVSASRSVIYDTEPNTVASKLREEIAYHRNGP